jgi:parallel beta-helix repeat protein
MGVMVMVSSGVRRLGWLAGQRARGVALALVLAGGLGALDGLVPAASAATTVSCGSTISTAGSYALAANCGAGIMITASDVTLNLNGHTMTGAGGFSDGVVVDDSGAAVGGVTIQGPGKITGYDIGVELGGGGGGVSGSSVSGLTFTNNAWAIQLNSGSGNTVSGNTAKDNLVGGILLEAENGDTISGNAANNNSAIGIDVAVGSTATTVSGNAANNDGFGILVNPGSTGNTISANDAHGNPDDDLADLNDACDSNTWTGNTFKTANQTCIH